MISHVMEPLFVRPYIQKQGQRNVHRSCIVLAILHNAKSGEFYK